MDVALPMKSQQAGLSRKLNFMNLTHLNHLTLIFSSATKISQERPAGKKHLELGQSSA